MYGMLVYVLLAFAAILIWVVIAYFKGNPGFWRLVARNPEKALFLFRADHRWLVDVDPPADLGSEYTGPFRFVSNEGFHKIYIRHEHIGDAQVKMVQIFKTSGQ